MFLAGKLNVRTWALALGSVGAVSWVIAIIWHGLLAQPSIAGALYPWFSWTNPVHLLGSLVVLAAGGAFYGALFAWLHNYFTK